MPSFIRQKIEGAIEGAVLEGFEVGRGKHDRRLKSVDKGGTMQLEEVIVTAEVAGSYFPVECRRRNKNCYNNEKVLEKRVLPLKHTASWPRLSHWNNGVRCFYGFSLLQ